MAQSMLMINGTTRTVEAPDDMPLLWVLRDLLGLTGTKFGCGIAQCGACTVHLDGQPVRSCMLPLSAVGKRAVTTIEGVGATPAGAKVQKAWLDLEVIQCGTASPVDHVGGGFAGPRPIRTMPASTPPWRAASPGHHVAPGRHEAPRALSGFARVTPWDHLKTTSRDATCCAAAWRVACCSHSTFRPTGRAMRSKRR
jgi:hypothetical protein